MPGAARRRSGSAASPTMPPMAPGTSPEAAQGGSDATAMRVAVLGAGTVGREVVHGLLDPQGQLVDPGARDRARRNRGAGPGSGADVGRRRRHGIGESLLTDAPAHLVADPDTDVIVELMGGDEPARMLIAAALGAGKSVVTANKHVIAHYGAELEAIARRTGAALRFEAAVGGGIPVLGPLAHGPRREPVPGGPRDRQRHHELHPLGDAPGGPGVRGGARRRAGGRLRRGRPDRRRRGHRRREQARDPRPARVRRLARSRRRSSGRRAGRRRPGITGVSAEDVAAAEAAGSVIKLVAQASAPRDADGERPRRSRPPSSPTLVPRDQQPRAGERHGQPDRAPRATRSARWHSRGPAPAGARPPRRCSPTSWRSRAARARRGARSRPRGGRQAALEVPFKTAKEPYPSGARYPELA